MMILMITISSTTSSNSPRTRTWFLLLLLSTLNQSQGSVWLSWFILFAVEKKKVYDVPHSLYGMKTFDFVGMKTKRWYAEHKRKWIETINDQYNLLVIVVYVQDSGVLVDIVFNDNPFFLFVFFFSWLLCCSCCWFWCLLHVWCMCIAVVTVSYW